MQQAISIIDELEDAVRNGTSAKRVETLRRVTDLFLDQGQRLSDDQVEVFDHVLSHLVARVENRVKAELGDRLAPLDYAPVGVLERLAWDDEIAVAGKVLTESNRLSTPTLVEIAKAKGQDHLYAISGRADLAEDVTDVLVERGESKVIKRLADNSTARFSEAGYGGMVAHADADDTLAEALGLRVDLPIKYLRDLLQRATEAVRARLATIAPPELQEEIKRILATITSKATPPAPKRDFTLAEAVVKRMKGLNELNDAAIARFAETKKFDEVAAALGLLNNSAPTELMAKVLEGPRADLVLIPCKSAGLGWATTEKILCNRPAKYRVDNATLRLAAQDFVKLSAATAERTLRFWQLHDRIDK
ncbi:DUF2336 domain-containing protein [uncultured Bradyrhizobium sp.]|uniref:DUF2336 domain-containing protein n=1 Tax=uncultured Bradyrhizobium sp. TaxID=199684 RepID=UPI0026331348|nr:DUF2336 domain-containing protein [uncultured Bradyrhizobium sp.]